MKIAMTSQHYRKDGGIGRYVAELAEHFAQEHEVHMFSFDWRDVGNENIIFHRIPFKPKPFVIETMAAFTQISIISKTFKSKYDIIHTQGLESLWLDVVTAHSIHAAAIRAMTGIPRSLGIMNTFLATIEKLNYKKYRNYKKIIADATSGKYELMKYYNVPEEDIVVIPVGINLDEFRPNNNFDSSKIRAKYGIKEDDTVLIIVATEFYRKGVVELIKAIDLLINEWGYKGIKLLVVGKAKNEGLKKGDKFFIELAQKHGVSNNIIFTGRVDDLNALYNTADLFVFPTKYEGFGIPTLEAMAMKLPVIVSKTGVGGDIVIDGKNGFLLDDPNDVREIADKISILFKDEKLRLSMGKNARKSAESYSWENVAKMTMDVYKSI